MRVKKKEAKKETENCRKVFNYRRVRRALAMARPFGAPAAPMLNMEGWPGVCGGEAMPPNDVLAGVLTLPPKLKPPGLGAGALPPKEKLGVGAAAPKLNPPGVGAAPKPAVTGALPNPPAEAPKPPEVEDAGAPKPLEAVEDGAPKLVELADGGAPNPVEAVEPKPVEDVEEPKPPGAGLLATAPKLEDAVEAPPN